MIMGDDEFQSLIVRIASRKASWGDFDRLARFAEELLAQDGINSQALAALLDGRSDTVIGGFYIYKTQDGGAYAMRRKLNYEPNKREWQPGDIVIHDADEKSPKMLMIVLGYSRDGQLRSRYLSKIRGQRVKRNYLDCLHAPERFGLQSDWGKLDQERLLILQEQWEWVRRFNKKHAVGALFSVSNSDGSSHQANTTGEAYLNDEGFAVVMLSDSTVRTLGSLKPASEKITA